MQTREIAHLRYQGNLSTQQRERYSALGGFVAWPGHPNGGRMCVKQRSIVLGARGVAAN